MNLTYLSDSKENEMQIHLNSFFILAKNNIEENLIFDDLQKFTSFSKYFNLWTNFSLNFKDDSFVDTVGRNEFNMMMINKILMVVLKFLENSVSDFGKDY